ncbi:MAG: methyl-accepting chemotaxis protein [Gammaproteobacteria bacterium]
MPRYRFQKIMDSVKKVTEIVGDIANSSQEQAPGIEQVNKAINDMDSVTQQNTSLVEEVSVSANPMNQKSTELSHLVGFFNIDKTQQHVEIKTINDPQDRR